MSMANMTDLNRILNASHGKLTHVINLDEVITLAYSLFINLDELITTHAIDKIIFLIA